MIRALALAAGLILAAAEARAQDFLPLSPEVERAIELLRAEDPRAVMELERLVAEGRADAQLLAGSALFVGGSGFPLDKGRACRLWKTAAVQRADAAHLYAECLQWGYGDTPKDGTKARVAFEAAFQRGYVKSGCALGNMLIGGEGGPVDIPRGLGLCRSAAESGDIDAQTDLGDCYLLGKVVTRDVVEARRWYEEAAAKGQKNAAFTLGQIYWNGDSVTKDNAKAAEYWRLAYAKGRKDAAVLLGNEAFVRVVSQDAPDGIDRAALEEALGWYERADREAPASRARIAEPLSILRALKAKLH